MNSDWQLENWEKELTPLVDGWYATRELPAWPVLHARAAQLTEGTGVADLLWRDTSVFADPRANAGRVFVAVKLLLERTRPLHGAEQEFLDLYQRAAAAPQAFGTIWPDPRCYHWTRYAYQLTVACLTGAPLASLVLDYGRALGSTDPAAALALQLGLFKGFALGIALQAGTDCLFERPFVPRLPFALPGTDLCLYGEEPVAILGLVKNRLQVQAHGQTQGLEVTGQAEVKVAGLIVQPWVRATHAGYSLPLEPAAFNVPGLAIAEPALRAGRAYQLQHVVLVSATLANLQRYAPEVFAAYREGIRIAALKPRPWGSYDDFSEPELPGTFIASVIDNPLEMGDHLVHEFQHNRLSCIEESGPLFDSTRGDPFKDTRYYSPWRDKLRALYGIYHGIYVFIAVGRYWLRAYQTGDLATADRAYVIDRLLRLPWQLVLATAVVRRHAQLTVLGQTILDDLVVQVEQLRRCVQQAGLPADAPAWRVGETGGYEPEINPRDGQQLTVRQSLREHVARNDTHGQCAGLMD